MTRMHRLRPAMLAAIIAVSAGCASTAIQAPSPVLAPAPVEPRSVAGDGRFVFPSGAPQGALVFGRVPSGSRVEHAGRVLRVTPYGTVAFGLGRDEIGPIEVFVTTPDGERRMTTIQVLPRDWPTERVDGVPPATVKPPPEIAARIAREQALVSAARVRDDARSGFAERFISPLEGRVSGRFGRQRVYNGEPGAAHSGMDIAAPTGTPVRAPASGVVTFAAPDLYLTGGTVLLDHGHGVSSNFLHLSRIDVRVGDTVRQGDVVGAVGATGRATGPHLHWGMNWFDVRIDPQLVLERGDALTGK
jgi:biotin carboxyl carrier protein